MPSPLFGPVFIAGATAAIGYFFQEHSKTIDDAKRKSDDELSRSREQREADLTQAQRTFTEVVTAMDKLHYYVAQSIYIAMRNAEGKPQTDDGAKWAGLNAALLEWGQNKTRFATLVSRYFGAASYQRLKAIDSVFTKSMIFVNETYYNTEGHKKRRLTYDAHKARHFRLVGNSLEKAMFEFSDAMIRDVQTQNVGTRRRHESEEMAIAGEAIPAK